MRLLLSCIARPVKQHLKPCVLAVCCMCSGMHVQTHLKAASLEFAVAKSSINKGIAWCYPAGLGGRLQPVPIAHIRSAHRCRRRMPLPARRTRPCRIPRGCAWQAPHLALCFEIVPQPCMLQAGLREVHCESQAAAAGRSAPLPITQGQEDLCFVKGGRLLLTWRLRKRPD